ncbi:host specificity factor TipJ family phage tail protein [Achromobacter seleniivolatilans]|uniref:Host specificity factor TipJ family phage tail protein n=1 Tax=Achromobacter seleniivolatilans TaxID=3047478 RepID=A0ABY9M7S8_9BURK|nr:host specificity factor TipJ family phage tail protein [Achromobacter sp. R39]WMD23030.1 host specificity factor TipJ family phage tail protein [Achromobacter sp. R39]
MEIVEKADLERPVTPSLLVVRNPFVASEGREAFNSAFLPGETLGAYCERVGVTLPSRVVNVWHNGYPVPLDLWKRLIPRIGDQVVIRTKGEGGGGGGKVLRTVAMIAVVVVSIFAPYLAPAAWGAGFGTIGGALISAGVMLGGSLLVNALLPPLTPTAAKLGTGQKYESSPTYSIQGGRNRARPWETMILVFGQHKVVPDLAGTPYTMLQGQNQFLNQTFHFGLQGVTLNIDEIKIGNTPISNYQGVQIQVSGLDGKLSMFPGNVDTIQGFPLNSTDGWQTRTTGQDVTGITVEAASRLFRVNDDGTIAGRSVDIRIQYRAVGTSAWSEFGTIGVVYATHYWAAIAFPDQIQIEFGSTNPSEHTPNEVFTRLDPATGFVRTGQWQWRPHPNSLGQPWQGIAPDPLLTPSALGVRITGWRQEPTRIGVSFGVPAGQYEIRVMKVTPDINDTRESNETAISQILAFQNDRADYSGQCRVAVRIMASGQLNGAIDELNAVVRAWCVVWNGSAWNYQPTSNPAWWFLWFARGKLDSAGHRIYGGGLSDAQIDIEGIKSWALWCDQKKLTFDYVLDQKMSAAAVLQIIARAGRASITYQTGKLGVMWDAENVPATAMFGPLNVRSGSFKVAYVNEGTVDEIVANFINKDAGWVMDEVRAKVPGAIATNNPMQLDLDGCVSRDMAGREANLIAASQVWRRRKITWETDIEGLVCTRGDVVSFSHDLTVWGYSGRMMPGSAGVTIKLQNSVPSNGTGVALLRDPDGNMKTVSVSSAVGDVNELLIVTDLDGFPMPGDAGYEKCSPFDWAWQFDPIATPGRRFKVSGITPAGDGLRFEAVDDDPEYYACEANPYLYTPPRDGGLLVGMVFSLTAAESIANVSSDQIRVSLSWVLSRDMPALVTISVNGAPRISQTVEGRSIELIVQTGDQIVARVTPKASTGGGTPKILTYQVEGLSAPLAAVEGLTTVFRDGLTVLSWRMVVDVREPAYEVRVGESWANSRTIGTTAALEMLAVGNGSYWVAARFKLSNGTVVYGPAAGIVIAGAVLVRNVLLEQNEAPDWTGTVSGGAFVYASQLSLAALGDLLASPDLLAEPDLLWMGGAASDGIYTNAIGDQVDIGYVSPVRMDFDIEFSAISQDDDLLAIEDWLSAEDLLNGSARQAITVRPQIRHAQAAGEWSDWVDFVPGLINARYFDVRLYLATSNPRIIPFVSRFVWTVDVPDLVQRAEALAVVAAGMRVTFPKEFHAKPNLQVTILDSQNGDRAVVSAATADEEGFDIRIFNGSTAVERKINWIAQGY